MHPLRKRRLITVLFIVAASSVAVGLMLYAARESINLFYPPSKILAGEAPIDRTLKAGGCVVPGSIQRSNTDLSVNFLITDGMAEVPVSYTGILPDLFEEGEAAVVDGKINSEGVIMATRVLAKHDETYMPPEVSDALQDAEGADHVKTCEALKNVT